MIPYEHRIEHRGVKTRVNRLDPVPLNRRIQHEQYAV